MVSGLQQFFRDQLRLRAVIETVLEGRCGRARSQGPVALLDYGCYRIPAGNAASRQARELCAQLRGPCEIVVPPIDGWRALLGDLYGSRIRDRSMESFVPGVDLERRTAALSAAVPQGYELQRLDADRAAGVVGRVSPHGVEVLGGPASFAEHGFGWGLLHDGAPACAATSYAISSRYVEIAIGTHADHRGLGLAACAAAAMIQEALQRELEPHWNASNPVSQRLARRLGFEYVGMCEILALDMPED